MKLVWGEKKKMWFTLILIMRISIMGLRNLLMWSHIDNPLFSVVCFPLGKPNNALKKPLSLVCKYNINGFQRVSVHITYQGGGWTQGGESENVDFYFKAQALLF